jgi:hypothetical protein
MKIETLELSNCYTISGPISNVDVAKKLVEEINKEMEVVYKEFGGGGSRAMDERDDVVYEYEAQLNEIGYTIDE